MISSIQNSLNRRNKENIRKRRRFNKIINHQLYDLDEFNPFTNYSNRRETSEKMYHQQKTNHQMMKIKIHELILLK